MMCCSDTPQGMLTPRRVALAALEALADGLPDFFAPFAPVRALAMVLFFALGVKTVGASATQHSRLLSASSYLWQASCSLLAALRMYVMSCA